MSSSSFGPGWRSWWKGDAVHAAFAKLVDKALRTLAYETRLRARDRIVRRGWGSDYKTKTTKRGKYSQKWVEVKKYKGIYRRPRGVSGEFKMVGDRLMKRARVRYYQPSRPGQSPTNQRNILRGSILYDFRKRAGVVESFVGPVAMAGKGSFSKNSSSKLSHWSMTDGLATRALEHGGWSRNHQGEKVYIAARPFMRPAQAEVLRDAGLLPRALRGGFRGLITQSPGSGWVKS